MLYVDLKSRKRYQPLDTMPTVDIFDFGCKLAHVMPDICVRAPMGDGPDDEVVLDGKLLSKRGVAFF